MMIRRLLRRLIKWALAEPKGVVGPAASTPTSRQFIVDAIRLAKINREL
jgi:hypothetical protein